MNYFYKGVIIILLLINLDRGVLFIRASSLFYLLIEICNILLVRNNHLIY